MVLQRVAQTIESIENELVLDPAYREQVDSAWGFCNVHARQWLESAQPLSTAIIYEAVLGRISRQLDQVSPGRLSRLRLPGRRSDECSALIESRVCPLCRARDDHERQIVAHLVEELKTEAARERYASSDGLCVPHLNLALCAGPAPEAFDTLRSRLADTHEQLRGQLREVIRKHDYRYRDEGDGPEWSAIDRAIRHVTGEAGIDRRRSR
jgi:hypothetical protein